MDSKTITKFRLFGKTGKIIMTVLTVIAVLITVLCCSVTVFVATLPKEALIVHTVEHAEFRFNAKSFDSLWNILGGSFTYAGESNPENIFKDGKGNVTPPENQEFESKLKFFNQSYSYAKIHSDGNTKVMEAESSPEEYNAKNLVKVFAFLTLFAASATVAIWMLRMMFAVLEKSESPFRDEVVSKMRNFGISLLPVAVIASISETLTRNFLSSGKNSNVNIQWGVLIAFVITMALVEVFKYGVQLQRESDETL